MTMHSMFYYVELFSCNKLLKHWAKIKNTRQLTAKRSQPLNKLH